MSPPTHTTACPGPHIPGSAVLLRLAAMGMIPLMCLDCPCGTVHLIAFSPDGAETVATGGSYLRARFELLDWPRSNVTTPSGILRHHFVPDGGRPLLDAFLTLLATRPPGT